MTPFDKFIALRFLNLYGEPAAADRRAFVDEYRKALGSTRTDILEKASDYVVKHHAYPTWPTIGECRSAIQLIADELHSRNDREASLREQFNLAKSMDNRPRFTKKQLAECDELVAKFKAHCAALEDERAEVVPLQKTDRKSWIAREKALHALGKLLPSHYAKGRAA